MLFPTQTVTPSLPNPSQSTKMVTSNLCQSYASHGPAKTSEVMRARAKRFARDLKQAHERRREILRRMMNLLRSAALAPKERKGCTTGARQGEGARDAQINQSINQSQNQPVYDYDG